MCRGYAEIAKGLKIMAAGYEMLAEAGVSTEVPEAAKVETAKEEVSKEEQTVDVKDVRAVMRQKIKDGKMDACQEILHSFGCEKLTDVPAEKLAELLAKVEGL